MRSHAAVSLLLVATLARCGSDTAESGGHALEAGTGAGPQGDASISPGGGGGRDAGTGPGGAGGRGSGGAPASGGEGGAPAAGAGGATPSGAGGAIQGTGGGVAGSDGAVMDAGTGGAPGDAAPGMCGTEPCISTRCSQIGCGPAACCASDRGPVCVRGTVDCPSPGGDAGPDTAFLRCWSRDLGTVLSRACTVASDCFVALHWASCCSVQARGLAASEQPLFEWLEASCGGAPPCGCCCDRATTDDGQFVAGSDPANFAVDCIAGQCRSSPAP